MGITSTHVENTAPAVPDSVKLEDHLHTRGEYDLARASLAFHAGSPPHTWRIPTWDVMCVLKDRITSTHVENTRQPDYLY